VYFNNNESIMTTALVLKLTPTTWYAGFNGPGVPTQTDCVKDAHKLTQVFLCDQALKASGGRAKWPEAIIEVVTV
jgi:hypothetical protein